MRSEEERTERGGLLAKVCLDSHMGGEWRDEEGDK